MRIRSALLPLVLAVFAGHGAARENASDDSEVRPNSQESVAAVQLVFEEREAGMDPYRTRYLVTPNYLRIDDGTDGADFILLDRRTEIIYSTNEGNRTILTITHRLRKETSPIALELAERQQALVGAPTISGLRPEHHTFLVNEQRCYDVVAVPGLAEDAVEALKLYRLVLASEHKRMLPYVPPDTYEICDLAHNVFAADRYLQHGLPIEEWDQAGYRRALLDIEPAHGVDPSLFSLPAGYRRFTMEVSSGDGA